MGILLLPSLEEKRHIRMDNVSQPEAEYFMSNLSFRVLDSRKLSIPEKTISDSHQTYKLISGLSDFDIEDILEELAVSTVPRHRGIRAAFVDADTDTILVGTTVVYSANWAMIGFDDVTIADAILNFED